MVFNIYWYFYVTKVTFWMTLHMNKWINIVMDDGELSSPIGQTPTFSCQQLVMEYCHG